MTVATLVPAIIAVAVLALFSGIGRDPAIDVEVVGDEMVVRQGLWDAIYSLRRTLRFPIAGVAGVVVARRDSIPAQGMRLPGTGVPGVIRAGSYGTGERRDFWNVRRGEYCLVIQLEPGQEYRRLVLEVADPQEVAQRLRARVGAFTGPFF